MSDFYYITSNRGYKILVLDGYKFHKKAIFFKGTKIKWICAKKQCPVIVFTDIDGAVVDSLRGAHCHEPTPTNKLVCSNISNTLKQDNEIGKKRTSEILKEHLRKSDINLSERQKINIHKSIWRQLKKCRQKRPVTEDCSEQGSADEKSEQEGQPKNEKGLGESLDSFPEDGPSSGMDEGDQDFEPETAFVPVGIIKEEPEEITEESNYLNMYPGDESLNALSNTLNIRTSDLMPEPVLKTSPPASFPPTACASDDGTSYPPPYKTPTREDICINPGVNEKLALEMDTVVSGTDTDFTNLKNVVSKLEKISDRLALAAVADQYEQFGKYLATLLRGIPQKKFLSLKQKFIGDVIKAKMALDELNGTSATGTCTVARPANPPNYNDVVDLNNPQTNPYQSTCGRLYGNGDAVALSKKPSVPVCRTARHPDIPEAPPVVPTPTTLTTFTPVMLRGNGMEGSSSSSINSLLLKRPAPSTSSKKRAKIRVTEHFQDHHRHMPFVGGTAPLGGTAPQLMEEDPLRCTEDRFEIDIEEGTELKDIKPTIFDTSTSSDYRAETRDISTPQQPLGVNPIPSAATIDSFSTTHLTCDKCNLNFGSSTDRKRHFMVSHPGEILSFKKMCSAESQNSSLKIHSQELLSTSATPLKDHIEPGDLGSQKQLTEWPYPLQFAPK